MFEGAYAPDFQRCGHCIDLLTREALQKLVSVDKYDFTAGVKTSCKVGVRALRQMLRGKRNSGNDIGPASEPKT